MSSSVASASSSASPAVRPLRSSFLRHRTIFVLIDGVADVTIRGLQKRRPASSSSSSDSCDVVYGCTPLQSAHLPHLDSLAQSGLCGLLDSVESGLACGSDVAHLSLLGYDPLLVYRGRGALEAGGSGLDMQPGDVAFKANFATIKTREDEEKEMKDNGDERDATIDHHTTPSPCCLSILPCSCPLVTHRRCDRHFPAWGLPLVAALDGAVIDSHRDVEVAVRHATEHRCAVRIRGDGLTDVVDATDPIADGRRLLRARPTTIDDTWSDDDHDEQGSDRSDAASLRTASVINATCSAFRDLLAVHPINISRALHGLAPANVLLLRGAGAAIDVVPFTTMHSLSGRAMMVAPTAIIAGIGLSLGFDLVPADPRITGNYDTNLIAKARTILDAMMPVESQTSFGFLHIKAIDDAGHDKDVGRKVEWLEKVDDMIGYIIQELNASMSSSSSLPLSSSSSSSAHADSIDPSPSSILWSIVVTGDHSTPVLYGDHSCEPVPFVVASIPQSRTLPLPRVRDESHRVRAFDEFECAKGVLGRFTGREVMPMLGRIREAEIIMEDKRRNRMTKKKS